MSEKLFVVERHSAKRKESKKKHNFSIYAKNCNNEADQNRLFCHTLRRAAKGEITNK